jgi:hypothetical protein
MSKIYKTLLTVVLCLSLVACPKPAGPPQGLVLASPAVAPASSSSVAVVTPEFVSDPLIICIHKYTSTLNITFNQSKRVVSADPAFPQLTIYHIVDIHGVHWSVNQYEMENYTCTIGQ